MVFPSPAECNGRWMLACATYISMPEREAVVEYEKAVLLQCDPSSGYPCKDAILRPVGIETDIYKEKVCPGTPMSRLNSSLESAQDGLRRFAERKMMLIGLGFE